MDETNVEMNTIETEIDETETMVPVANEVSEVDETEEDGNGLAIAAMTVIGAAAIYGTVKFGKDVVLPVGRKAVGGIKNLFSKMKKPETSDTAAIVEAEAKEVVEEVNTEDVETVKS